MRKIAFLLAAVLAVSVPLVAVSTTDASAAVKHRAKVRRTEVVTQMPDNSGFWRALGDLNRSIVYGTGMAEPRRRHARVAKRKH